MQHANELKENGRVWELMPITSAQQFLWGKGYGPEHPSRLAVRDWIKKTYKASGAKHSSVILKPSLLDVPSGSGVDFKLLGELVDYTGMDRTPGIVDALKANFPEVKTVTGDIRAIPLPDKSFDIVLARAIFEHLPDKEDMELAMKECVRVAKKHVIFSFFIPLQETEHIAWDGQYFNNQYARKDVEAILGRLGGTWTHEFIDVKGTEHVDSYDIFYVTL